MVCAWASYAVLVWHTPNRIERVHPSAFAYIERPLLRIYSFHKATNPRIRRHQRVFGGRDFLVVLRVSLRADVLSERKSSVNKRANEVSEWRMYRCVAVYFVFL